MYRAIISLSFFLCSSPSLYGMSMWQKVQGLWTQLDYPALCVEKKDAESCLQAAKLSSKQNELHKAEYFSALACQFESEDGCRNQQIVHDLRNDRIKDYQRALKQYARRCKQGLGWTCARIAKHAEKSGEKAIALERHQQGCGFEFPLSCQWLALWHETKKEPIKAQEFRDKAKVFLHKLQYGILPEEKKPEQSPKEPDNETTKE